MSLPPLWPHQAKAVKEVLAHIGNGVRRIVLTSPTGGGKSRIVAELIRTLHADRGWKAVTYTNRKMLLEQLVRSLEGFGLRVGARAAGRAQQEDVPIQVSSIQTEESRVYKRTGYLKWELHPANVVFIDEAHLQSGREEDSTAAKVKRDHYKAGAVIIEVTATPVDLDGKAEVLVVAGTNSDLRACGALVPAHHYGPDEPDLRYIGLSEVTKLDDLSENKQRKLMGAVNDKGEPDVRIQRLFGRVLDWHKKLNPDNKPTILFAPGVAESRWFAREFCNAGIPAAHLDGAEVWTQGVGDIKADKNAREELGEMSRDRAVKVVCNRFVLREGIDWPWLAHGIFATAFGSMQSYLQSGGRLLRAYKGLESVTIQDHGGNWWRHGSLNADRTWPLGSKSHILKAQREDALREKKDREPLRCPRCSCILLSLRCVCGFVLDPKAKTRPVVQENGTLVMMEGDVFRPQRVELRPDTETLWTREYFRAKNSKKGMTFRQARANFYLEHGYYPPDNLPLMPLVREEQWSKVANTSKERLVPCPPKQ